MGPSLERWVWMVLLFNPYLPSPMYSTKPHSTLAGRQARRQLELKCTWAGAAVCALHHAMGGQASSAACEVQYCSAVHVYFWTWRVTVLQHHLHFCSSSSPHTSAACRLRLLSTPQSAPPSRPPLSPALHCCSSPADDEAAQGPGGFLGRNSPPPAAFYFTSRSSSTKPRNSI
jgi:hypothetical protein